jgi:hypothetical protein
VALAAVLAGVAVASLPRLGWALLTGVIVGTLAAQQHPGAALALLAAALCPVLLAPAAPTLWPLAAGAPALGAAGLAGAWPAVAANATNAWRRAALGASGWLWLLLAEPLTGIHLYAAALPQAPLPSVWTASLSVASRDVLGPLVSSGAWLPAILWGAAAAVLPALVRGRSPKLDAVRVAAWSVAVPLCTASVLTAAGVARAPALRGVVLGALAGALLALAAPIGAWVRHRSRAPGGRGRAPVTGPGIP